VAVAVINGTMLTPGVSLNNRLYTAKAIGKAVARMQERIADPDGLPIVMRTHHQAGDNSRLIVGKLTSVNLEEDGSATYKAQLYGTQPGKDIATLVTGPDPALRSVSISGGWLGPVRTTEFKGQTVETAEDLVIDAVDFTATPGVVGALISRGSQASESVAVGYTPISESFEATVTLLEEVPAPTAEADKKPYGDVPYADPGKQSDGVKRYPVDTAAHAKAAWSYINMPKNAAKYSAADLKAIKGRIKAALAKFGVKVSEETAPRLSELREYYPYGADGEAGFCIDAYAGPLSVTVRGCVPGEALRDAAMAAVTAAMGVFLTMDPDQDADIDVGMPESGAASYGGESVKVDVKGSVVSEADLRDVITRIIREMKSISEAASPDDSADGPGGDDSPAPSGDASHSHTHDMADGTTHTHGHLHTHETANGGSYDHTHGHTHQHLPGGEASHTHMHNHDHATAPQDTHENATDKETAMSETETNPAAEAAPSLAITAEHLTALTAAITALAEASKPAVAPAEEKTPETPAAATEAAPVTETAPVVDVEALKKEIRDGLRAEILKENGLPQRTGLVRESTEVTSEQERADAWANRTALLLGDYGKTPVPMPGTGIAQ
jgi:hypothetical protein